MSFTFIDLFAGCGGLAMGFVNEAWEPVDAAEWDQDAAETYRLNIDDRIRVADIEVINRSREGWPAADALIGGPPCQGFSQLGARDPDDARNKLWREYIEVLDRSGAEVFVMENVPQLLRSAQYELLRDEAERRGFQVEGRILCAADYGVPQLRYRAIVIGSRLGAPPQLLKTHGLPGGPPYVTVRQAFKEGEDGPLSDIPDGLNWHRARPNLKDLSLIRYAAVPVNGGNRFQMEANLDQEGLGHLVPECWRRKRTGTTDVFGRLWWDRPACTIRTEFFKPEKGRYLHPTEHRPITVREAARLQSFEDAFVFPENHSMVSVAKQIGNAVPPRLAAAVARAVGDHLRQHRRRHGRRRRVETAGQLQLVAAGAD